METTENKEIEIKKEGPSHNMDGDYAVLMETSGEEFESWYYFIKVQGNEENLKYLQDQLELVEWYILDDLSTFDLDLEHYVSAQTAKEMTKLDLNHTSFHRKFDGVLKKIDLGFTKKDKNKKKIRKTNEILGYGAIEDFIDDEDIDEDDLRSGSESDSDSDDTDNESLSSSDSDDSRYRKKENKKFREEDIPPSVRLRESIRDMQNARKKGNKRY